MAPKRYAMLQNGWQQELTNKQRKEWKNKQKNRPYTVCDCHGVGCWLFDHKIQQWSACPKCESSYLDMQRKKMGWKAPKVNSEAGKSESDKDTDSPSKDLCQEYAH